MERMSRSIRGFFKKHPYARFGVWAAVVALIGVAIGLYSRSTRPDAIPISELADAIASGRVASIADAQETGKLTIGFTDGSERITRRDTSASFLQQMALLGVTESQLARLEYEVVQQNSSAGQQVLGGIVSLAMLGMVAFTVARVGGRGLPIGATRFAEGTVPDTTFRDVAGLDECRQELADVVSFLHDRSRYEEMGARIPRGVLLVGAPGTGKTLLARAIAGEAGVPFFSTSGSEFVEVFVGLGASRVRNLFKKARAKSPCIVFIDEIDAAGRKRHTTGGAGEMEQDQTLNQLLVEMDGFTPGEGVVVLAATNRSDVLDPALTRPGRFDRQVSVPAPDLQGRRAILEVHAKDRRLAPEVDLMDVARSTPGLVGADLAAILNEAAILAVRAERPAITSADLQEAVEKAVTGGALQRSRVLSQSERRTIAYHEAGHAVVMHDTPGSDPVQKVSIVPRGQMGGFTLSVPEEDRTLLSRRQLMARVTGLMGGRVAEEVFCGDITSGASNDLRRATDLAEEMVMRLGMGETGLRVFPRPEGYDALLTPRAGPSTSEAVDAAIGRILDESYAEAKRIITEKREVVERVTSRLLEQETLARPEFEALLSGASAVAVT